MEETENTEIAGNEIMDDLSGLLGDLNGGTGATPLEAEELAAAVKDAGANPLVIDPATVGAPQKTPAQRIMDKMGAVAGSDNPLRGYKVTVEGNYSAPSVDTPGRKVRKPYIIEVNLPTLEGALSVIKNKMLDKMLKVKYRDYVTYLTHQITNVQPLSADTPESNNVAYMSADGLLGFVRARNVPIDLARDYDNGKDIRGIRASVVDFLLNPGDFKIREGKRLASAKIDKELEVMNPSLAGTRTSADGPV